MYFYHVIYFSKNDFFNNVFVLLLKLYIILLISNFCKLLCLLFWQFKEIILIPIMFALFEGRNHVSAAEFAIM